MPAQETLRIVTDLDEEAAIRLWLAGIGIESPIKTDVGERTVYWADGPGMILMSAVTSERARAWMTETFDLPANLEIGFDLDFCRDRSSPQTTINKGTLEFLPRTGADGALWVDTNKTLLLMTRDGELILNDSEDLWTRSRLALVTQPYRREALVPY